MIESSVNRITIIGLSDALVTLVVLLPSAGSGKQTEAINNPRRRISGRDAGSLAAGCQADKMFREAARIVVEDGSAPSAAYIINVRTEDLTEKLKLLNYDTEFLQEYKMKPMHRYYFITPTNPGEQFHAFTSLAAWLIRKAGGRFDPPQESDDPNSTIALILDYLRELTVPVEFPPNKLKQGIGEHAVYVLDHLADEALKAQSFQWKKVDIPPDEPGSEPEVEEDDAELILEKVEEEMLAEYDEEDEDVLHVEDITKLYARNHESQRPEDILESRTSREEWLLELERVLPQLKVTIKTDSRDWRSHVNQMKQLRANIATSFVGAKGQLDKLHNDIASTLDKIKTRESYLNRQLEPVLQEYQALQEELSKIQEKYRDVSGGVTERTRTFNKLTEELDQVKREMDERGSSMTDGTPLINIKKSITKMKSEISEMNVRIGVLEYSLMCGRIRDRTQLQEDMNNTGAPIAI